MVVNNGCVYVYGSVYFGFIRYMVLYMCTNMVEHVVPTKYHYKTVVMRCGSTGYYGAEVRCESCEAKGSPWYICRHGNDVSEYGCDACEAE